MITITKKLDLPDTYPLDRIGPLLNFCFLILKPPDFMCNSSNLYLIGCTYFPGRLLESDSVVCRYGCCRTEVA